MSYGNDEEPGASLSTCTVGILRNGEIVGTGFFVSKSGEILTCYHVIEKKLSEKSFESSIFIRFGETQYESKVVNVSPQPSILDFAILQLTGGTLPVGANLIPLGFYKESRFPRTFQSYGFRSNYLPGAVAYATGQIIGPQVYLDVKKWQLASEASANQQMREGMSGAPIFDDALGEIIGMFVEYSNEDNHENIPLALSLESISVYWEPLEEILEEHGLWQQLKKSEILKIGGEWFTAASFRKLYHSFLGLRPYSSLRPNHQEEDLLEQLKLSGKTREFIDSLKSCQPQIPVGHFSARSDNRIRFLNREDEKSYACESLSPPYIFFEGPMGYGKTWLLAEIRKKHFREGWLCISLEVNSNINSLDDLISQIYERIKHETEASSSYGDIHTKAIRLATMLRAFSQEMPAIGVLLTLDNAEKLSRELVKPFAKDFLHALSTELDRGSPDKKLALRLRAAGRHFGAYWEETAEPIVLRMMLPFEFKYVEEAVRFALPEQNKPALYASHLMYASAGHPRCMAETIKALGHIDENKLTVHFSAHKPTTSKLIGGAAHEVKKSMMQDFSNFAPLLEKLSVYPVLDRSLLGLLIKSGYVDDPALDKFTLEERLPQTHYYDRADNCLYDHISRRVLALELRVSNPDEYQERCQQALGFYHQHINQCENHIELMFLAVLELELSIASLSREKLNQEDFFGAQGILERSQQLLNSKPIERRKEIVADIDLSFTGKRKEKQDKDFRFLLNFLLNDGDYSNYPYEQFLSAITNWKQACLAEQ